jgi:DMSO/TMAO reductase YedYZ molybdopterin-dependent catalytic subunit
VTGDGRTQPIRDLSVGFAGGLVALVAAVIARATSDTVLLAQIAVDAVSFIMPANWFSYLLDKFEGDAKPLLYGVLLAAQLLAYALIAAGAAAISRRVPGVLTVPLRGSLTAAMSITLQLAAAASLVIFTPAAQPATGWLQYTLVATAVSTVFAITAEGFRVWWFPRPAALEAASPAGRLVSRRLFLRWGSGMAAIAVAGLILSRDVLDRFGSRVKQRLHGSPTPPVTSNEIFYTVSKNLFDPMVAEATWRLEVDGEVRRPLSLTLADIRARPSTETYDTLECISNRVGGDLIGNALWKGIALLSLVEEAGPGRSARFVMFESADGYTESLPLEFALDDKVRLVYEMNGVPLPATHGFPLRVVSPGKYGIKHPKWLTRVTLIDEEHFGYWQQRGWDQRARLKTTCRIDVPTHGDVLAEGRLRLHGLAFAGDRGISRVEVSTDGGTTWTDASLSAPLSPWSWVLWQSDWHAREGKHELMARATDGEGVLQEAEIAPPEPDGASGYHRVTVRVLVSEPEDEA